MVAIAEGIRGERPHMRLLRHDADGKRLPMRPSVRRLTQAVRAAGAELVAIDAPLSFPHAVVCGEDDCAECFAPDGPDADYTERAPDRTDMWSRAGYRASPMPTGMLGALTFRGIYLRRTLERLSVAVIEAWPRGVFMSLRPENQDALPASGSQPDEYLRTMTEALSHHAVVDPGISTPDEVDALATALAAWTHVSVGIKRHLAGDDGEICICTESLGGLLLAELDHQVRDVRDVRILAILPQC